MKNPDIAFFLLHIAECSENILSYLLDVDQQEFFKNKMIQDAVIRNFEIMGEAAKHIPDEFRDLHSEIHWKGMAGFRDILIHEYFGIDLVNVWNISTESIPDTLAKIKKLPEYIAAKGTRSGNQ